MDVNIAEDPLENSYKWDLPLKTLYKLALGFYKEKSAKAIHLSYEDNLKLVAFTQQAAHGPLDLTKEPPLGVFDVIGKNRRSHWQNLGTLSKAQAIIGFIELLNRLCPMFKPYIEAIKKDREEKGHQMEQENRRKLEQLHLENVRQIEQKRLDEAKNQEELQRRQLQDALNQQTYYQFKQYSEKQYPGNPEQQAVLIKTLQNEHYHQYMQQLQSQVKQYDAQERTCDGENSTEDITSTTAVELNQKEELTFVEEKEQCESDTESGEYAVIQPANMWTRHDIKEFKKEVSANKGDGVIRVGHGDTVTVRVPTLEGGRSFFFEFATDSYDIGFGVYFEWGKPISNEVTVHVSESDDEEDAADLDEEEITCLDDLESGGSAEQIENIPATPLFTNRPPLSIIVPVYRRECQNEVYAGSHTYPGQGCYLLKFDNSFSMFRSKNLYYRIFYTR